MRDVTESSSAPQSSAEQRYDGRKVVPAEVALRRLIRREAGQVVEQLCCRRSLDHARIESLAAEVLDRLRLAPEYQGFAMVAVGSEFWRERFAGTPFSRRLLLMPHCLRKVDRCRGTYSAAGLACARCGACGVCYLLREAESLGYQTLVAEGTPAVVQTLAGGGVEAILGVACLDSLERCFNAVLELGVPYVGVPLLKDGCVETDAELDVVRDFLSLAADHGGRPVTGYINLLQAAAGMFSHDELRRLVRRHVRLAADRPDSTGEGAVVQAEEIALDWLGRAGKRFRPFITLAAYAARKSPDEQALDRGTVESLLGDDIKAVALALEAFHKASLAHDDVEDHDQFRYGRPTLHARYGEATAINAGDYLIGLGYRLVAAQADSLGADCVADILSELSSGHLKLCRGQGAELLLTGGTAAGGARPADVLAIYALKTAPAFAAAIYAGMRMAGPLGSDGELIRPFCRHLGVAYQILDDMDDFSTGDHNHRLLGQDIIGRRPTLLRAFASTDGVTDQLERLFSGDLDLAREETVGRVREIYHRCGAFDKARRLVAKCRDRALEVAAATESAALGRLMQFLTRVVLREQGAEAD
ncbi:MAG: DUF116 domain-containing protein [Anaerolineaceae bacterium]|nr:DUF116 domain-containing protein [Anaerolineaceae bacterium]